MSGDPTVSVIVPVRDRPDLLRLALRALAAQTFEDAETIVIDDGSTTPVREEVEAARSSGLRVRYLRTEGVGAVEARILGVAEAKGSILAFTDSDCEPDAAWLAEGVKAIDAGGDVVQGVTVPVRRPGTFERSLAYSGGEGLFATCNVFYRRTAFDAAGGFDRDAYRRLGFRVGELAKGRGSGEDSLLGWDVAKKGTFTVAEKAIVRHAVERDSVREWISRAWQIGVFPAMVREMPELRTTLLRHRIFLGSDPRPPLYVLVLSLVLRAEIVAAIAATWWLYRHVRRIPRDGSSNRTKLGFLALNLVLDVVKATALVAGSLRTRTPVL